MVLVAVLVALPSKSLSQRYHFGPWYTAVTQSVPSETPVAPVGSSPGQPYPVDTHRTGTLTQASASRARNGHTLSNWIVVAGLPTKESVITKQLRL